MVKILTDSIADLPSQVAKELDVTVVPILVCWGEELFRDGIDMTAEQFYERLKRSKIPPSTSVPSPGTVFDSSIGGDPLQFTLGQGQVIQGFEQAIIGMAVGEQKTVSIPSAEAYGPYRDDLVIVMDKANLSPDWKPEIGAQYSFTAPDGSVFRATVTEITESTVTIDRNHPLAGKDLIFDIELVEIVH